MSGLRLVADHDHETQDKVFALVRHLPDGVTVAEFKAMIPDATEDGIRDSLTVLEQRGFIQRIRPGRRGPYYWYPTKAGEKAR